MPDTTLGPESQDTSKAVSIYERLAEIYPSTTIALDFETPFQLLVATILSAQCTDKRVNQITPKLFRKFATPESLAEADVTDIEHLIKSAGMYRTKARNLKATAIALRDRFGSQIPHDLEALQSLPGVGRKTANVVLNNAFGIASGIAVDTHVKRVSARLGLTTNVDPLKIEEDLKAVVPREAWIQFSLLLIRHGRLVCTARKPKCGKCAVRDMCDFGQAST